MGIPNLKAFRRYARQIGKGTAEFIIIVVAVGIGGIFVYTQYGDVLRAQMGVSSGALAGEGGDTSAAQNIASAMGGFGGWMGNFGSPGSGGGGSGSPDGNGGEGTPPGNNFGDGSVPGPGSDGDGDGSVDTSGDPDPFPGC
ncbi:MAG: hypothetical protein FWD51_00385 [Betaproteobacteria bacterium]|nr:hypothetical protein [Betaproteobacteria bacterium]